MDEDTPAPTEPETPADVALEDGDRLFDRLRPYIYGLMAVFVLLFILNPSHAALYLIAAWTTLFLGICLVQIWAMIYDIVSWLIVALIIGAHALVMYLLYPYLLSSRYVVGVLGGMAEFALVILVSTGQTLRFNRWKRSSL